MPASPERAARAGLSAPPKIAIAVDLYDWHARDLTAAFTRLGAIATPIRLAQCGFDTKRKSGLVIPGFGFDLPDAVFVRAIGSGGFEGVTLRLSVLHGLGDIGVPVVNSARAIEICVDKAATSFALARANIPTPPTFAVQSHEAARKIVRREAPGGPLVLKPLFGAQGFGLKLILREEDLPPIEAVEGVYYLQRFVGVERDGFAEGVDMIIDADGEPQVLEVNSMPGWRGLQKVAPFSIADRLARDFLKQIGMGSAQATVRPATEPAA